MSANTNTPTRGLRHVLKAEGCGPDATDRERPANASPGGGPVGAEQPAAAGLGRRRRVQPPWMAVVAVGDVLRSGTGTLRVVRKVSRYLDGDLRSVTFAIRHGSWTGRPYTVMGYTDLRMLCYSRVGARVTMNTELDRRLNAEIADHHRRTMRPSDVRGVA